MKNNRDRDNAINIANAWIHRVEGPGASVRDQDIYPMVSRWLQETPGGSILDLGCGQGICSQKIDFSRHIYTGIDASTELIERACKLYHHQNRNFVKGWAQASPFPDEAFDGVFSVALLHLVEDLPSLLSEINRVLKPGKSFLIITPNPDAEQAWKKPYGGVQSEGLRFQGEVSNSDGSTSIETLYWHSRVDIDGAFRRAQLMVQKLETFRQPEKASEPPLFLSIVGQK